MSFQEARNAPEIWSTIAVAERRHFQARSRRAVPADCGRFPAMFGITGEEDAEAGAAEVELCTREVSPKSRLVSRGLRFLGVCSR